MPTNNYIFYQTKLSKTSKSSNSIPTSKPYTSITHNLQKQSISRNFASLLSIFNSKSEYSQYYYNKFLKLFSY